MASDSSVSASCSMVRLPSLVGGGRADDADLDRERLVEEHLFAVDLDQADQVVARRRVDLAAAVARVDEGAEPDLA